MLACQVKFLFVNNPKYGEEYRNILKEHKNKLRREGNRLKLHKKRMKEDLGYRTEVKLRQYIRESIKRQSARKQSKFKKLLVIN